MTLPTPGKLIPGALLLATAQMAGAAGYSTDQGTSSNIDLTNLLRTAASTTAPPGNQPPIQLHSQSGPITYGPNGDVTLDSGLSLIHI